MVRSDKKKEKDIEELRKLLLNFVIRVVNLVKELPNNLIGSSIGGQLLDAGTSIGANFEEACAAFSCLFRQIWRKRLRDFTYKLAIAKKESYETHYWLRGKSDTRLLPQRRMESLIQESLELKKILTSARMLLSHILCQNRPGKPMIYVKISDDNRKQLQRELGDTKDARWYRRLKIIDLSSCGKTVSELAEMFNLSSATVRDYIHRYNTDGIFALQRSYSPGRPPKIEMTKEQWEELLRRSPVQFEALNTAARNWTQELLVEYCKKYLETELAQSSLCLLFKRLGIKWNRGKLKVTSAERLSLSAPDPLYTVKRERVETLKKK